MLACYIFSQFISQYEILTIFTPFLDFNVFVHTTNSIVSLQKTSFKLTIANSLHCNHEFFQVPA